jgi:ATP-binding cassette subfamily B protein
MAAPRSSTWEELSRRRRDRPVRELPDLTREAVALVFRAARREAFGSVAISVVLGVLTAVQLVIVRNLLSALLEIEAGSEIDRVVPSLVAFAVVYTLTGIGQLMQSELRRLLGERVARYAQVEIATAAARVELVDFERPEFHDLLQRAASNASTRPVQVSYSLITIITSGLTAAGVIVALAVVEPILLLMVAVAFGPVWILTRQLSRLAYKFDVDQTETDRRRSYLTSLLMNKRPAKEVRMFRLAPYFVRRLGQLWDARLAQVSALVKKRVKIGVVARVTNGVLLGFVVFVLAWLLESGRTSASDAAVAAGALVMLSQRLGATVGGFGQLYESSFYLRDVRAFLAWRGSDEAAVEGEHPGPFEEVRADDVHFRYPASTAEALRGVTVHVARGEVVALVGANGSGKTTLAKLLAQLYTPTAGRMLWNGEPATRYDPFALSSEISALFQDFEQYMFSGRENIGFGRVDRLDDDGAVVDAAQRAGAHDFLSQLAEGYDSLLGPEFFGGSDLSIGQWQRVALGRAFMRDASLVILDEPSAALDPEAEAALFTRLRELCAGRAVLIISHRFSTVTSADRSTCSRTAWSSSRAHTRSSCRSGARITGCSASRHRRTSGARSPTKGPTTSNASRRPPESAHRHAVAQVCVPLALPLPTGARRHRPPRACLLAPAPVTARTSAVRTEAHRTRGD